MSKILGIIRETKNEWERRTPLVPDDIKDLLKHLPIKIYVQPSDLRIYNEQQYQQSGAEISMDLSKADIILGIKEIKIPDLLPDKIYLFFSHTIKGQDYNMPMLEKILDLKCTLLDYEKIMNASGQRLIYFSLHAGLAGIVETLWAYGQILNRKGIDNPFADIKQTYRYNSLDEIKKTFRTVAECIRTDGLPTAVCPLVIGITGYGNVARGVRELVDILPFAEIDPGELHILSRNYDRRKIYISVFKEEHMVEPVTEGAQFELQDYYDNPDKYRSRFRSYLPYLNILVNATYWDTPYPRHITKSELRELYQSGKISSLAVIGDISCDIEGGVEITFKATEPGKPVYTYDPLMNRYTDGLSDNGIVVMAVDNLPSELPKEASEYFSGILKTLVPDLVHADFTVKFENLDLPPSLKDAIIVYRGAFTPGYTYLQEYL